MKSEEKTVTCEECEYAAQMATPTQQVVCPDCGTVWAFTRIGGVLVCTALDIEAPAVRL